MTGVEVVKLPPDEWRAYRQLRLEALLLEPQAFSSKYAEVAQRPDAHWQERLVEAQAGEKSWLLFARDPEGLAGMIGAYCEDGSDAVDIISVYVTREKRGQGIGAALMAAILAEVGRRGVFRKAVLAVNAEQAAAVALYRKFGFAVAGEETNLLSDGLAHREYIMEKALVEQE